MNENKGNTLIVCPHRGAKLGTHILLNMHVHTHLETSPCLEAIVVDKLKQFQCQLMPQPVQTDKETDIARLPQKHRVIMSYGYTSNKQLGISAAMWCVVCDSGWRCSVRTPCSIGIHGGLFFHPIRHYILFVINLREHRPFLSQLDILHILLAVQKGLHISSSHFTSIAKCQRSTINLYALQRLYYNTISLC